MSNNNVSINNEQSTFIAGEDSYEVVWETEGNPVKAKAQSQSEPPKIDLKSLTRATQKTRLVEKQEKWRRVLKFAKVPYRVPTDKQSAFGSQQMDYKEGSKKSQQNNASSWTQEAMFTHVGDKNSYSILGIAKPGQYQKENKYELIACGDYNSYAIINI